MAIQAKDLDMAEARDSRIHEGAARIAVGESGRLLKNGTPEDFDLAAGPLCAAPPTPATTVEARPLIDRTA